MIGHSYNYTNMCGTYIKMAPEIYSRPKANKTVLRNAYTLARLSVSVNLPQNKIPRATLLALMVAR